MSISLNALKRNYQSQYNTDFDSTHEYFNMEVVNEYTPNNTQPLPLVFSQTKNTNIINKADDYFLSVIRWNFQSNLPVLIPDIDLTITGLFDGKTVYQVGLAYSHPTTIPININEFAFVSGNGVVSEVSIVSTSMSIQNPSLYSVTAVTALNQLGAYDTLINTPGTLYYSDVAGSFLIAVDASNGNVLYSLNCEPIGFTADIINGGVCYFTGSSSRTYIQILRTGLTEWTPQTKTYTVSTGDTTSCAMIGDNLFEVTFAPDVVINQWTLSGAGGSPDNSVTVASGIAQAAQIISDGTDLYIFSIDGSNVSTLYKYSSTLGLLGSLVLSSSYTYNTPLPLCGFDNQGNIILAISNIDSLVFISASTLTITSTQPDPNAGSSSYTSIVVPLSFTTTFTEYVQAGDVKNLIFIPETVNTAYASSLNYPADKEQLYNNSYFYIKYVDTFCRMLNEAIASCFATISGATWATLPYFQWNAIDQKIEYFNPNSTPVGVSPMPPTGSVWSVICNQPLFSLLSTFRFKYFPKNAGNDLMFPESCPCRYVLDTNILQNAEPSGEYAIYTQQTSSVQTWSPVQSIVFQSTVLPIEPQLTGQPQNLNTTDPTTTQGNTYKQQALTKILTDFVFPLTTGTEITNQELYYVPSGEYRLVDLLGGNTINQLTFSIFWKDKFGVLHPMTIDAGSSASLLCMLRKKTYKHIDGY